MATENRTLMQINHSCEPKNYAAALS